MNKYERSYELANRKSSASWYDTAIAPLAADLEAATGKPAKISGPFGLRAEVYIDVGGDFIRITPEFPDDGLKLYYDTGAMTQTYQPLTLGDCNGMNNVRAPLPDTLEEIVKLLRPLRGGAENE